MSVLFVVASAAPAPEATPEAKPLVVASPIAYSAPLISQPIVTATSSQYIARNYNGLAVSAPLIAAPSAYAAYSPYIAASYTSAYAYSAGLVETPSVFV